LIPPDLIFGKDGDKEAIMNLMTSDEIIEELQKIVYQSNGLHKRLVPEDKENLHDFGKVQKLESRLGEVVKENETLIDELQDKKYEVYNLKNKNLAANEIYNDTQNILGQKLSHMMRQMGNNKNEITQLGSESESDV
jgi:vacuolar-type H+-ATPase subunit I/STV1